MRISSPTITITSTISVRGQGNNNVTTVSSITCSSANYGRAHCGVVTAGNMTVGQLYSLHNGATNFDAEIY